jgi:hypothetical protein
MKAQLLASTCSQAQRCQVLKRNGCVHFRPRAPYHCLPLTCFTPPIPCLYLISCHCLSRRLRCRAPRSGASTSPPKPYAIALPLHYPSRSLCHGAPRPDATTLPSPAYLHLTIPAPLLRDTQACSTHLADGLQLAIGVKVVTQVLVRDVGRHTAHKPAADCASRCSAAGPCVHYCAEQLGRKAEHTDIGRQRAAVRQAICVRGGTHRVRMVGSSGASSLAPSPTCGHAEMYRLELASQAGAQGRELLGALCSPSTKPRLGPCTP